MKASKQCGRTDKLSLKSTLPFSSAADGRLPGLCGRSVGPTRSGQQYSRGSVRGHNTPQGQGAPHDKSPKSHRMLETTNKLGVSNRSGPPIGWILVAMCLPGKVSALQLQEPIAPGRLGPSAKHLASFQFACSLLG